MIRRGALLSLAGAALFGAIIAREQLLLSPGWEPLAQPFHAAAFWIVLPVRVFLIFLAPPQGHHYPWQNWLLMCLLAPFVYWGLYSLVRQRARAAFSSATNQARRNLVIRGGGLAALAAGGYASVVEPTRLRVREMTITIRDLPAAMDGFRILHISDTHYGPFVPLPYLEEMVRTANSLSPDLIALTGDYVHQTPLSVPAGVGVLAGLRPRLGALAVLGNHDHWEGVERVKAEFAKTAIPLIENDRVFITRESVSREATPSALCIAGLGDLWEGSIEPDAALRDIPPDMPRIVLEHNPDTAEHPALAKNRHRIDLMLSGHTHGGQVSFPGIGAPIAPIRHKQYTSGLCQANFGPVLVSCGVGMAVLPIRLGVPPEIGMVTLRCQAMP